MQNEQYKNRSQSEYKILIEKFRRNEISAVKELYEEGMWWSVIVSKYYMDIPISLEELVMTAFSGWLKALEHYDFSQDYKLSTYATWWIKNEICKTFNLPI